MKKIFLILVTLGSLNATQAQLNIGNLSKSVKDVTNGNSLSQDEVAKGLKEALNKGIEKGVKQVSQQDGYFKDPAIKIELPSEAEVMASKLRSIGQGQLVDDAILSMNRAAEDAAQAALDIFVKAISNMNFSDAMNILKGEENAATNYLKKTTYDELYTQFKPIIEASLQKVGATKYWTDMVTTYNKIPLVKKMNPDLTDYVTEKAIEGLFVQVAKEEALIRENPSERTTELLRKVFADQ